VSTPIGADYRVEPMRPRPRPKKVDWSRRMIVLPTPPKTNAEFIPGIFAFSAGSFVLLAYLVGFMAMATYR
jgi:hypothetical protein